jgi:glycosyltransferase involved in cell wall biosynthesis
MYPDSITLVTPKKIALPARQLVIPFRRLWTQIRLSWEVLINRRIKTLFIPSHVMPLIHPKKTVITLHDAAFKRTPESYGFLSRNYLDWSTRFAVRRAKKIIVPSETTKRDLMKFYKADEKKIEVIPHGFDRNTPGNAPGEVRMNLERFKVEPHKYFLFVGRIETKKDLTTLVKAFRTSLEEMPGLKLLLCGKPGVGSDAIHKEAEGCDAIVFTGYLTDKEKWILLENCLAFVFPSLYEGFGLPLLEAMHAGVPIIASKIPTSWEIAKENALFFKTGDTKGLAEHLEWVANGTGSRSDYIKNHKKTLEKYSWNRCAKRTWEVLDSL